MSSSSLAALFLPFILGLALLTGACGAPLAVAGASYAADGGFLAASNKTSTDHMISMVSKQDCAMWRVLRGRAVCKEREGDKDPYNVDYNSSQRTVAEDGVHYTAPLRASPDAPATSWDAAAYKSTPAPVVPATPIPPVTAVAAAPDAPPVAEPAAAPVAAAKPTLSKAKARSVKKPSRGPAAPPS